MKAILVIDMPPNCSDCQLCDFMICFARQKGIDDDWEETRPNWCPLIPIEAYDELRAEIKKRMEHPERYPKR